MLWAMMWTGSPGTVAVEERLELGRPIGDAVGHAQLGRQHAVADAAEELRNAAKIAGDGPAAQLQLVEAEQAVNQDNRGTQLRNLHGCSMGAETWKVT